MDTLPQELRQGVEEFNRAYFFEAHETLEDLWRGTSGPLRLFYQGLIHIDVDALCAEARVWLDHVRQAGNGELTVDPARLPRIRWLTSERNSA